MSFADTAKVRQYLHQHPELSGEERETSRYLQNYITTNFPGYRVSPAANSYGFIASKVYGAGGHIAFRAELDALPITEEYILEYASLKPNKSHACGHDGHMSILLATMQRLEDQKGVGGTASFIFQPAEETGKGAELLLEDEALEVIHPDALLALHNIPGRPFGRVMSREGGFACGSVGVVVKILGTMAHAAHPEEAVNPMSLAIGFLEKMTEKAAGMNHFSLVTPIAIKSGDTTFGVSPVKAKLLLTLRSESANDLDTLIEVAENIGEEISELEGASATVTFEEYFPVTENHHYHENLKTVCENLSIDFCEMDWPFRWSEDFGHYSRRLKTHMFGLGAGEDTSPLHSPTYDFPDGLIEIGSSVFLEFYLHLVGHEA